MSYAGKGRKYGIVIETAGGTTKWFHCSFEATVCRLHGVLKIKRDGEHLPIPCAVGWRPSTRGAVNRSLFFPGAMMMTSPESPLSSPGTTVTAPEYAAVPCNLLPACSGFPPSHWVWFGLATTQRVDRFPAFCGSLRAENGTAAISSRTRAMARALLIQTLLVDTSLPGRLPGLDGFCCLREDLPGFHSSDFG